MILAQSLSNTANKGLFEKVFPGGAKTGLVLLLNKRNFWTEWYIDFQIHYYFYKLIKNKWKI